MRGLLISLSTLYLLHGAQCAPMPQLTEEEFNARARSLDAGFDNEVFMISGYSQVKKYEKLLTFIEF